MARAAAVIQLTDEEREALRDWTRGGKNESRLVERSRIILMADEGNSNQQIARRLNTRTARVSKWRQRFAVLRLSGLEDGVRTGKPARYDQSTEKRVLRLLDEAPPRGFSKWNGRLVAERLGDVNKAQVWRIFRRHDICLQRRGVGASAPTRNLDPKPRASWGCMCSLRRTHWCCRWTKSRRFRRWNVRRGTCGCRTARRSTATAIAINKRHGRPRCLPR